MAVSSLLNKGTVAASWPIRNIMRQENRPTPPLVLHFGLEWGLEDRGFSEGANSKPGEYVVERAFVD